VLADGAVRSSAGLPAMRFPAVLPIYTEDILHVGPGGLGWLRGAQSLGAIGVRRDARTAPQLVERGSRLSRFLSACISRRGVKGSCFQCLSCHPSGTSFLMGC
jgi:hypothetical protein